MFVFILTKWFIHFLAHTLQLSVIIGVIGTIVAIVFVIIITPVIMAIIVNWKKGMDQLICMLSLIHVFL